MSTLSIHSTLSKYLVQLDDLYLTEYYGSMEYVRFIYILCLQ